MNTGRSKSECVSLPIHRQWNISYQEGEHVTLTKTRINQAEKLLEYAGKNNQLIYTCVHQEDFKYANHKQSHV